MSPEFIAANSVLITTQAALVALPDSGAPRWLQTIAGRAWALILPLSLGLVVLAIALVPEVADGLTWVALLLVPPGALLALGWAMRGARPAYALIAATLMLPAFTAVGTLGGDAAAAALTALSAITLGRLLAGLVPSAYLKAGIVAMAILDAILVFGNQLQGPAGVLNAAVPAPGLPQFQYLELHYASLGYGDVFVAGVLGGVLAQERRPQTTAALLTLALSALWDLLFLHFNTLPATVPVAAALVILELRELPRRTLASRG